MGTGKLNAGVTLQWTSIPSRGRWSRNIQSIEPPIKWSPSIKQPLSRESILKTKQQHDIKCKEKHKLGKKIQSPELFVSKMLYLIPLFNGNLLPVTCSVFVFSPLLSSQSSTMANISDRLFKLNRLLMKKACTYPMLKSTAY